MKNVETGGRWSNRPDGTQAAYYRLNEWSRKRIAWEFIRRNTNYQKACDKAVLDQRSEDLEGSPGEYGSNVPLRHIVDYTSDWSEAEKSLQFSLRSSDANLTQDAGNDPDRFYTVVLDIHKLTQNAWTLEARLAEIERGAKKRMKKRAIRLGRELTVPRLRPEAVGRSLRYLDMVSAGFASRRIKDVLYPDKSAADRDRDLDKDKKRAVKYSKGHVAFVLLEELARHPTKRIPTDKNDGLAGGIAS